MMEQDKKDIIFNMQLLIHHFESRLPFSENQQRQLHTFLFDGFYEDLSRILKKLSVELKDADGRSDAEVTRERWENDRKRNNSVIVDSFKSFLVCPECNKEIMSYRVKSLQFQISIQNSIVDMSYRKGLGHRAYAVILRVDLKKENGIITTTIPYSVSSSSIKCLWKELIVISYTDA
ncbi:hypothetical protein OUZ56_003790 [Daphnia magna]|uniref:Uncharacterized protein n=1 Tax=Daphnia magna TaxID=35525 RepID=A0ABQ9YMS7_9CRUS|nr:hypothetical protein OUZ56_003790 [Daphnia magna]